MKKLHLTAIAVSWALLCGAQEIHALKDFTGSGSSATRQSPAISASEADKVSDLAFKLHPTAYFRNGQLTNKTGNALTTIDADAKSLSALGRDAEQFQTVKMLKLKLSRADKGLRLDATMIQSFKDLKYVLLESDFNCSEADFKAMIPANSNHITWLYNVAVAM